MKKLIAFLIVCSMAGIARGDNIEAAGTAGYMAGDAVNAAAIAAEALLRVAGDIPGTNAQQRVGAVEAEVDVLNTNVPSMTPISSFNSHTGLVGSAAHSLGTASTHAHEDYATAGQGTSATNAQERVGLVEAEVDILQTNVSSMTPISSFNSHTGLVGSAAHSLGTASTHAHEDYATAGQGTAWAFNINFPEPVTTAVNGSNVWVLGQFPRNVTITNIAGGTTSGAGIYDIVEYLPTNSLDFAGTLVYTGKTAASASAGITINMTAGKLYGLKLTNSTLKGWHEHFLGNAQ